MPKPEKKGRKEVYIHSKRRHPYTPARPQPTRVIPYPGPLPRHPRPPPTVPAPWSIAQSNPCPSHLPPPFLCPFAPPPLLLPASSETASASAAEAASPPSRTRSEVPSRSVAEDVCWNSMLSGTDPSRPLRYPSPRASPPAGLRPARASTVVHSGQAWEGGRTPAIPCTCPPAPRGSPVRLAAWPLRKKSPFWRAWGACQCCTSWTSRECRGE